jgi:glyoxylase-like metal-dependent hydrolase (beta-lactamase superfamily II)
VVGVLEANCYILKSEKTGIIVDPGDEADRILRAVQGLDIRLILATHRHSDHVSAVAPVKDALGVRAAIHPRDSSPGFEEPLRDGQIIEFGRAALEVIHTPGHTPGGCCFICGGALISGDTLFPDGPGNTSYPGGDEGAILRSIRERLMVLPDPTVVYPGHGSSTTIGRERSRY